MTDINKLTLELFMNKSHFHKYLAKSNPQTFERETQFQEKVALYHPRIIAFTETMLQEIENPDTISECNYVNTSLHHAFRSYLEKCIEHLDEMQETVAVHPHADNEIEEDEALFEKCEPSYISTPVTAYSTSVPSHKKKYLKSINNTLDELFLQAAYKKKEE